MIERNGSDKYLVTRTAMAVISAFLVLLGMAVGGLTTVFATGKQTGEYTARVDMNVKEIQELKQIVRDNSLVLRQIDRRLGRIEGILEQR